MLGSFERVACLLAVLPCLIARWLAYRLSPLSPLLAGWLACLLPAAVPLTKVSEEKREVFVALGVGCVNVPKKSHFVSATSLDLLFHLHTDLMLNY